MKLFSVPKSKKIERPYILPTSALDVFSIQSSTLSVQVDVQRMPFAVGLFTDREARLRVKLTNEGSDPIENLSIEALAPNGTLLVDPGILFGNERRHVRLPRLNQSKSVTYKLGIRANAEFTSGVLEIIVRESAINAATSELRMKVGIKGDGS